jgi:hypothetical protein
MLDYLALTGLPRPNDAPFVDEPHGDMADVECA